MSNWNGLVPRSLCEALESQVIADAYPGISWQTAGVSGTTIVVTIPVTPQHRRTRRIGVAEDLARLSTEQLRQLIGLYFPEPADPRSLLSIITDRCGHLWRFWWQERRDPLDTEGNQLAEQSWQELQAALSGLQSVLSDILPEETS
jgi:hypothetical protein